MTKRWLVALAVVTTVGLSASSYVLAQAPAAARTNAAAATSSIPRTLKLCNSGCFLYRR